MATANMDTVTNMPQAIEDGPTRASGTWLFAVILVACALISSIAAFQMSISRTSPAMPAVLWPGNGWAKVRAANMMLVEAARAGADEGQIPTEFAPGFAAYSREALLSEPLAASALRNLGLSAAGEGDTDRARRIMRQASELSRRDALLNLWLSQDYSLRGEDRSALRQYDILLRTNTRSLAATLPLMASYLANEAAIDELYPLLAVDPPWHQDFWAAVIQDGSVASNAGKLRARLHRSQSIATSSHDSLLLNQLIEAGDIDGAFALYEVASRARPEVGDDRFRDTDFTLEPMLPPFDWETVEGLMYGSSVDREAGALAIIAEDGASGVVVRQLVSLEPGNYDLTANFVDPAAIDKGFEFSARIACAELLGARTFDSAKELDSGRTRFSIDGDCRRFWFSLSIAGTPTRGGDVLIDSLSLRSSNPS